MADIETQAPTTVGRQPRSAVRAADLGESAVLLLLATMLMYMDRQALAQQKTEILGALDLNNEDYGRLEQASAWRLRSGGSSRGSSPTGSARAGFIRLVLLGWSSGGVRDRLGHQLQRAARLPGAAGFFRGRPLALCTGDLAAAAARSDRPLGNSILQSGASLGAIATPIVVLLLTTDAADSWRLPFRVIGAARRVLGGCLAGRDPIAGPRARPWPRASRLSRTSRPGQSAADARPCRIGTAPWTFVRRFLALAVVVITINLCWQYFRAWMPGMLREQYGYSKQQVQYLLDGLLRGHRRRLPHGRLPGQVADESRLFGPRRTDGDVSGLLDLDEPMHAWPPSCRPRGCSCHAALIGFGSLGQFPIYYAFSQELSARRMGKITGALSFLTWTATALVNEPIGGWIDQTHSYSQVTFLAGLMPFLGFVALLLLWNGSTQRGPGDQAA